MNFRPSIFSSFILALGLNPLVAAHANKTSDCAADFRIILKDLTLSTLVPQYSSGEVVGKILNTLGIEKRTRLIRLLKQKKLDASKVERLSILIGKEDASFENIDEIYSAVTLFVNENATSMESLAKEFGLSLDNFVALYFNLEKNSETLTRLIASSKQIIDGAPVFGIEPKLALETAMFLGVEKYDSAARLIPRVSGGLGIEPTAFFKGYVEHFSIMELSEIEELSKPILEYAGYLEISPLEFLERVGHLDLKIKDTLARAKLESGAQLVESKLPSKWRHPWQHIRESLKLSLKDRQLLRPDIKHAIKASIKSDLTIDLISEVLARNSHLIPQFGDFLFNMNVFAVLETVLAGHGTLSASAQAAIKMAEKQSHEGFFYHYVLPFFKQSWVKRGAIYSTAGFVVTAPLSLTHQLLYKDEDKPLIDQVSKAVWDALLISVFMGTWSNARYTLVLEKLPTILDKRLPGKLLRHQRETWQSWASRGNSVIGGVTLVWYQNYLNDDGAGLLSYYNQIRDDIREEMGLDPRAMTIEPLEPEEMTPEGN